MKKTHKVIYLYQRVEEMDLTYDELDRLIDELETLRDWKDEDN